MRALIIADNSRVEVLSRAIAATFLILGVLTLITLILKQRRVK